MIIQTPGGAGVIICVRHEEAVELSEGDAIGD
jgi:hypothetical protein